jgi:hypothetical protein
MLSAFISSVHSYPAVPLAGQLVHQRYVHPGPLVLRTAPFKSLTPATDRDRTVSRRSEPSSRATLIGEQPNPWDRIQPQDVMSRHRGAKPPRRCGRLGGDQPVIPRGSFYPLSDGTSTCYTTRSLSSNFRYLLDPSVSQLSSFMRLHSLHDFPSMLNEPLSASVTL